MKTINLDALGNSGHRVEIGGQTHVVKQITARVANIIASSENVEGHEKMTLYYDAVALLIPTMPRGEVDNLSLAQLGQIITIARAEVDTVEEAAADPNAESSAPTTVTEPASTPET